MTKSDLKKLVLYWFEGAESDWKMHQSLLRSKHFGPSLFYMHLALEKLIKALIVQQSSSQAPFNHNLVFLMGKTNLVLSEETIADLGHITTFNMNTRYPTDIHSFYRTATREYVLLWQKKSKEIRKKLIASFEKGSI